MRTAGELRSTAALLSATKRRVAKQFEKQSVTAAGSCDFSHFCDDLESPHLTMNILSRGDAKKRRAATGES